jgi:hypothetical protein
LKRQSAASIAAPQNKKRTISQHAAKEKKTQSGDSIVAPQKKKTVSQYAAKEKKDTVWRQHCCIAAPHKKKPVSMLQKK